MNKNIGALILIGIIIFVGFGIPQTMLLGNQEISNPEYDVPFNLFFRILIGGVLMITAFYFARYLMKKDDKYTNAFGFFDIGEKIPFFKRFTSIQLTYIFAIIFAVIFLITNIANFKGFVSAKFLPQQFTAVQSLVFSTILTPTAEEAFSMGVTALFVLILVFISITYKISPKEFNTYYFVLIPIAIGIMATIWHISAYKGSDFNLFIVFLFWAIKTLLNLAVGFFVVGWLFHTFNNFFIDYSRLFTSDVALYTIVAILIGLIALYSVIYRGRIFGTSQKVESIAQ